jgi:hypothetical protein
METWSAAKALNEVLVIEKGALFISFREEEE